MKNILFPTDFSSTANNAFLYALEIADELDASITTLHTYQLPDIRGAHLPNTLREVYESISVEKFSDYKDSIPLLNEIAQENDLDHIPVSHVMRDGKTIPTILNAIKREKIDLVVMGTTGASGMKKIFVGSVAGEILENAPCPVLAVPEEATFDGALDQIAITTSYKEEEKRALKKVIDFARYFEAEIHCINVDTAHTSDYKQKMAALEREFEHLSHVKFEVLQGNDILNTISAYVEENNIDILAMVAHRRNFFQELFNYSSVKRMSYHSRTPILSIQASKIDEMNF